MLNITDVITIDNVKIISPHRPSKPIKNIIQAYVIPDFKFLIFQPIKKTNKINKNQGIIANMFCMLNTTHFIAIVKASKSLKIYVSQLTKAST